MKDGIVIFDAPVNEGQSRWVIDAAKAKYPGKKITHLVLTHHHMDHTGGMRTYVAEGATVIVPAPTKAYFEQVVKAPHAVSPDALQKQPRAANIQEVAEIDDAQGRHHPDQPAQHSEPAFGRHADRTRRRCQRRVGDRPDLAARADCAQSRRRLRSAMRCASTTSPTRPSPAVMAPPPSRRRARRRWRRGTRLVCFGLARRCGRPGIHFRRSDMDFGSLLRPEERRFAARWKYQIFASTPERPGATPTKKEGMT